MTPVRTLIVDDDPGARRLHAVFVGRTEGFTVVGTVADGEAALAFLDRHPADLVLLDMQMPDFSGVEVLNRLRRGGNPVDVLVVSSARDRFTVRQAASARITGYLTKPFTEEALAARLQQYRDDRHPPAAERQPPLGQGEIDRLVTGSVRLPEPVRPAASTDSRLPKGLSRPTLLTILSVLDPVRPHTVSEVSTAAGVSPVTVRRYLEHLVSTGAVDIAHRYGRRGRPEVLYRTLGGTD